MNDEFHYIPYYTYREYVIPLITAVFICIVGSFPYWYGYHIAGKDKVFMGMVGRGTHASFGYLMFQRQSMEGKKWQRNQCTPEPLPERYFNPEWWLMGNLARWLGISLIQLHHIDRIFSVFLFVISIYYILCVVLDTYHQRLFTFFLITFGSGLGWIIWIVNYLLGTSYPLTWDMQGVQAFGYLINKPHFIRAFAVATLMYAYLIRGFQTGRLSYFLLSGSFGLTHLIIRPYYIPETFVIYLTLPLAYWWATHRWDRKLCVFSITALLLHIPAFIYYIWFGIDDPLGMRGWSVKDHFLGKPGTLIEYVFGVGWTFLCAVLFIGYIILKSKMRLSNGMIFLWAFVSWIFCNLYPYWKLGQEAGLNVFWVAFPILTVIGPWDWLKSKSHLRLLSFIQHKKWLLIFSVILIIFSLPTSIYIYINMFTSLKNGHPVWTYIISKDTHHAINWLKNNAKENAVVLATHRTSPFLFSETQCKTVTGSFILTINFGEKDAEVNRFYAEVECDIFQRYLLKKYRVGYVFFGPYEKQLSGGKLPAIFNELKLVFQEGDTEIYQVDL